MCGYCKGVGRFGGAGRVGGGKLRRRGDVVARGWRVWVSGTGHGRRGRVTVFRGDGGGGVGGEHATNAHCTR